MEPLSPRSTNILPKPKPEPTKSAPAKPMPTDKPAPTEKPRQQKNQKEHAPSPPQVVREPGKNGELYTTGEFLGKGGFAICYQGELARNNRVFAMKVVKSEMPQRKMQDKVRIRNDTHKHCIQLCTLSNPGCCDDSSFGRNCKFTRKCDIRILWRFIVHSHSRKTYT